MEVEHRNIIISNLSVLVDETDLTSLVPELLERNVFNERMLERILNPLHEPKRQKTDLYVEILKRGPQAFWDLLEALVSSNHSNLANTLRMEAHNAAQFQRSDSLTSVGSNRSPYYSDDNSESDGPVMSTLRKTSAGNTEKTPSRPVSFLVPLSTLPNPQPQECSNQNDFQDSTVGNHQTPKSRDFRDKVFNLPTYNLDISQNPFTMYGELTQEGSIYYHFITDRPVCVKYSKEWKINPPGGPQLYKMDSNPRGCALIINNVEFDNKVDFPDRNGAENDEKRFKALLEQLHFTVEVHRNKTKKQILEIVEEFSQKPEISDVDCLWVTIMTHGDEGKKSEEGEIFGVDGFSCRTSDIVSLFYSDACKAAIHKPKIFFFQACRGCLTDPGVLISGVGYKLPLDDRISYDGIRVNNPAQGVRVRTYSDVFIAYPTPDGIQANRDHYTGTWFIQMVVDVFSELAKDCHLEDMLKVVDERLKKISNLQTSNFQALSTTSIGWHKHLYFNPGLYKDKGATIRIKNDAVDTHLEEGLDEVDSSSSNTDRSPTGVQSTYARLKDNRDETSDSGGESCDCFNLSYCRTS